VTFDGRVMRAKFIVGERIRATLQNNAIRTVVLANGFHDFLENTNELFVVHALFKRDVQGEVFALATADVHQISSSGEKFITLAIVPISVETHAHDSVGCIKSFFYTVTVVNVNVDVQNPIVVLEQLKNRENDVVYKAET
jgi:hypothetical protein